MPRRLLDGAPETGQSLVPSAFWFGGENEIGNGIQIIDDSERGATQRTEREACLCVIESDAGPVSVDFAPTELLTFSAPHATQGDEADASDTGQVVERLVVAIAFAREDGKALRQDAILFSRKQGFFWVSAKRRTPRTGFAVI